MMASNPSATQTSHPLGSFGIAVDSLLINAYLQLNSRLAGLLSDDAHWRARFAQSVQAWTEIRAELAGQGKLSPGLHERLQTHLEALMQQRHDNVGRSFLLYLDQDTDELRHWYPQQQRHRLGEPYANAFVALGEPGVNGEPGVDGLVDARWPVDELPAESGLSQCLAKGKPLYLDDVRNRTADARWDVSLGIMSALYYPFFGHDAEGKEKERPDGVLILAAPVLEYFGLAARGETNLPADVLGQIKQWIGPAGVVELLEVLLHGVSMHRREMRHATRAAATAIMSRNLSHNIGSHVLSALGNEDAVRGLVRSDHARFYSYLRSRMDFLATIMTSRAGTAVPLRLYRDVVAPFRPASKDADALRILGQRVLLDRISAVRGLNAQRIRVEVRNRGTLVALEEGTGNEDVMFASPEGVMGAQALYAILENTIRNSAKFSHPTPPELPLTLFIEEVAGGARPMFRVRLSDGLGTADRELVAKLTLDIQAAIIRPGGAPRQANWGLAEIKCCAAFLRQVPIEEVDAPHEPPLVVPLLVDAQGQETEAAVGSLAYEFFLQMPREIVVVAPQTRWPDDAVLKQLARVGIDFVHEAALQKDPDLTHHLMLWYGDASRPANYAAMRSSVPLRLVVPVEWSVNDAAGADGVTIQAVEAALQRGAAAAAIVALDDVWLSHVRTWTDGPGTPQLCRSDGGAEDEVPPGAGRLIRKGDAIEPDMLLYDRHGSRYRDVRNAELRFWEPYQQREPVYPYVEHGAGLPPAAERRLECDLEEAALVRVLVVDERVQKALFGPTPARWFHNEREIPMKEVLPKMAIAVPDLSCDLDEPSRERLEQWLLDHSGAGIMVIHQNLLDRLERKADPAADWLAGAVKRAGVRHTVVDSGRGVPFKKLPWARFVRLSDLLEWTVSNKSKYHLVQTLFSSRRV